jgi:hypothetical protein
MDEKLMLACADGHFVMVDHSGTVVRVLVAGDVIELALGGAFQVVRVCSGGYKGWYYVTASGERGRFATSMQARFCQEEGAASAAPAPLGPSLVVVGYPQTARLNADFCSSGRLSIQEAVLSGCDRVSLSPACSRTALQAVQACVSEKGKKSSWCAFPYDGTRTSQQAHNRSREVMQASSRHDESFSQAHRGGQGA